MVSLVSSFSPAIATRSAVATMSTAGLFAITALFLEGIANIPTAAAANQAALQFCLRQCEFMYRENPQALQNCRQQCWAVFLS